MLNESILYTAILLALTAHSQAALASQSTPTQSPICAAADASCVAKSFDALLSDARNGNATATSKLLIATEGCSTLPNGELRTVQYNSKESSARDLNGIRERTDVESARATYSAIRKAMLRCSNFSDQQLSKRSDIAWLGVEQNNKDAMDSLLMSIGAAIRANPTLQSARDDAARLIGALNAKAQNKSVAAFDVLSRAYAEGTLVRQDKTRAYAYAAASILITQNVAADDEYKFRQIDSLAETLTDKQRIQAQALASSLTQSN